MLEDFAMEKKSSGRPVQLPVKGSSTESKKNQEPIAHNRPYIRNFRRRDSWTPPVTKDVTRKPAPQRNKCLDKKPRTRGQIYGGKESSKVAEQESLEYGSVLVTGKKKQNLNHLLNFHYSRDCTVPGSGSWRSNEAGWNRRSIAIHKHKYSKEQFLQANCQFVVRQANDYTDYLFNPDMLVNWNLIEQIRFRSGENQSCPICLYPPVAAKITQCGHVFCWSCMLHYLALSDNDSRKCPICFEAVNKDDLKSVITVMHNQFSVGEEITLRLMRRERGSLLAMPVEESPLHIPNQFLSVSEKYLDTSYSKLLLASPLEVMNIIEKEKLELEAQLISEADCPERCFTEQALMFLKDRELALHKENQLCCSHHVLHPSGEKPSGVRPTVMQFQVGVQQSLQYEENEAIAYDVAHYNTLSGSNFQSNNDKDNFPVIVSHCVDTGRYENNHFESMNFECLDDETIFNFSVDDLEISLNEQSTSEANCAPHKYFFFYQAADGQHIYLHALNVRMLQHQYGSLENCPNTLKGRILEKEMGSMTEELRNRLRYLQHLPVTCQFEVAEIQLKPPIITRSTIDYFHEQLEVRKRRRQRRARNERLREKKINEEEKRRMGQHSSPSIHLESHMEFPLCGSDADFVGSNIVLPPFTSSVDGISGQMGLMTMEAERSSMDEELPSSPSGLSFAQMLRDGKSRTVVAPERGKPIAHEDPLEKRQFHNNSESELELEGYVPVPDYKQSLTEDITKAMENAAAMKETTQGVGATGKKKKKLKQKVLFATGMIYNNK